jgi:hypothetical protein
MKLKHIILAFTGIAVIVIYFSDIAFAQCSMCRKIATDGTNTRSVGAGLNAGILYLLAIPYILLGLFFRKQIVQFIKTNFSTRKN